MIKAAVIFLLLFAFGTAGAEEYQNPISINSQYPPITAGADDYGIGDPFVLRHNGMYYLYPSSSEDRVRVYTSTNLVDWEYQGYCTENRDVHFAYAPEVVYWRGDFYMITSPGGGGHYILKSDSPLGIFRPVTKNFGYSIDGSFFVEDDGGLMILTPDDSRIKISQLDEDTMLPVGAKFSTGASLRHWTEGPGLFRRGSWYYLTFTGNHVCSTGYKVAYASRRDEPLGVYYQRDSSTLLVNSVFQDPFKGLGHSSNVIGPDLDSVYTAYHSCVSLNGPARLYNLDRLFTNGGLLYTTGPTDFSMPVPAMPNVYGDAQGELHSFCETEDGYFAVLDAADTFTQECSFYLDGGSAVWQMGVNGEEPVLVKTDGQRFTLSLGDEILKETTLPSLGRQGRLHTLRVEHTPDVLYLYIDSMRVMTVEDLPVNAQRVGAIKGENVTYSYMACSLEALGSSDNKAVKTIPGVFQAVHARNAAELSAVPEGTQDELALTLGRAEYPVVVGRAGEYCFDLLVSAQDAGKGVTISLDDGVLWQGTVPAFDGKGAKFSFTTAPVLLPAGEHLLTIGGDMITLSCVETFAYVPVQPLSIDFTDNALRSSFYTLGAFATKPSEGTLRISGNKAGFAMFGKEGWTDCRIRVRFNIPVKGLGASGILLHATDVSLYDAQVEDSYYGYSLSLSKLGVSLRRIRYGASGGVEFAGVADWKNQTEAELEITLCDGRVTVALPDEEKPLLSFRDACPFTHGLFGFFSTGKELTISEVQILPYDEKGN